MAENELGRAFATLREALTVSEVEMKEEIKVIEQQIKDLGERIVQLNGKQQTLGHDRQAISDMLNRYMSQSG